jgi:hypothetical protein
MRILSLILAFAIAASAMGAGEMAMAKPAQADEHACCKSPDSQKDQPAEDCNGVCRMVCCRTVTAPAEPIVMPLDRVGLTVRLILPPLLVNDLGEPQSIFHPPRA